MAWANSVSRGKRGPMCWSSGCCAGFVRRRERLSLKTLERRNTFSRSRRWLWIGGYVGQVTLEERFVVGTGFPKGDRAKPDKRTMRVTATVCSRYLQGSHNGSAKAMQLLFAMCAIRDQSHAAKGCGVALFSTGTGSVQGKAEWNRASHKPPLIVEMRSDRRPCGHHITVSLGGTADGSFRSGLFSLPDKADRVSEDCLRSSWSGSSQGQDDA